MAERSIPHSVAEAVAEDAEAIAALHDRELTPALLTALIEAQFPACLGLRPARRDHAEAWQAMAQSISELKDCEANAYDELAAEYAAIYLTGAYGVSPCESFWTDDDHLLCQEAMFAWRKLHAELGLEAADWRKRPDDHLVLQLLHIAASARKARGNDDWRRLAQILDEHTLPWLFAFAAKVAARSRSAFYVGLAALTAAWLDGLRDLLAEALHEPRPTRTEVEERLHARRQRSPEPVPLHFVPGMGGPSW